MVEEFYKKQKHTMKGLFYNVHKLNTLKQSIYCHQLVTLYTRIMIFICQSLNINLRKIRRQSKVYVNRETKINFNDSLDISISFLLNDTLCSPSNDISFSKLIFILSRIFNSRYVDIPNRKYPRKSILFIGKWYFG